MQFVTWLPVAAPMPSFAWLWPFRLTPMIPAMEEEPSLKITNIHHCRLASSFCRSNYGPNYTTLSCLRALLPVYQILILVP